MKYLFYSLLLNIVAVHQASSQINPGIMPSDCTAQESYSFTHQIKSSSIVFTVGKTDSVFMPMTTYVQSGGLNSAIVMTTQFGVSTTMIMNKTDSVIVSLMDMSYGDTKMKMGSCKKMNSQVSSIMPTGFEVFADSAFFKSMKFTGNSKSILGYDCKEYRAVNDETVAVFWMTKDLPDYFVSPNESGDYMSQFGNPLEMEFYFAKNKQIMKSRVISYSDSPIKIETKEYSFQ